MDWVRYNNSGAIRNQQLSDDLLKSLSFLPDMGLSMEVFSGGQAPKGSGGPRTGSTRHDHGNAADVFFYQGDRKLDWSNPDDLPIYQQIVQRARQNGVTGFGAGEGYMRPGSMHIGFGNESVWGAGGSGANAPEWLRAAYSGTATPTSATQPLADEAMAALGKQPLRQPTPQPAATTSTRGVLDMEQPKMQDYEEEMAGGIFGKLFPNMTRDRQDRIALALGGLSMHPNQAMMGMAQQGIMDRSDKRAEFKKTQATQAQQNKTLQWLANTYGPEAAAAFENAGSAGLKMWQDSQKVPDAPSPNSAMAKLNADLQAGLITQEQWEAEVSRLSKPGMALSVGADGEVQFTTGGAQLKPLTEGQSKDTTYATRAEGALPTLDQYDTELAQFGERVLDADPTGLLRGRFQDKEYQLAKQAADEFLQAILRKDTGAAITADEQVLYGGTYLPQPGDGPDVIEQKRQSRRRALEALKAGMPANAILAQERALEASGSGTTNGAGKPPNIPQDVWDAMTDQERALWAN